MALPWGAVRRIRARGPVSKNRCWAAVFVRFTGDFRRHWTGMTPKNFVLHVWSRSYIKMPKRAVDIHPHISTKIWILCGDVKVTLCIIWGKTSQFFVWSTIQIATKPVSGLLRSEKDNHNKDPVSPGHAPYDFDTGKVTLCIIWGKTSQFFVWNTIQIATKPVSGPLLGRKITIRRTRSHRGMPLMISTRE